eukprot:5561932-Karenia_brevis.AAC.1
MGMTWKACGDDIENSLRLRVSHQPCLPPGPRAPLPVPPSHIHACVYAGVLTMWRFCDAPFCFMCAADPKAMAWFRTHERL